MVARVLEFENTALDDCDGVPGGRRWGRPISFG